MINQSSTQTQLAQVMSPSGVPLLEGASNYLLWVEKITGYMKKENVWTVVSGVSQAKYEERCALAKVKDSGLKVKDLAPYEDKIVVMSLEACHIILEHLDVRMTGLHAEATDPMVLWAAIKTECEGDGTQLKTNLVLQLSSVVMAETETLTQYVGRVQKIYNRLVKLGARPALSEGEELLITAIMKGMDPWNIFC